MTTALIVGDIQRGITGAYPFVRQVGSTLTGLLPRARADGVLVVFVRTAFRPNRADLPPGNPVFSTFFDAGDTLDLVLRAQGIHTVALSGVATGAMVAATAYDAADRGYRVTVLRDGCADGDPAVHEFFMDKVFPGRGFEVRPCAGWPGSGTPGQVS